MDRLVVATYDARGNGDGQTVNTLTGDHNNRVTDYTSVVVEPIPIHDKATRYKGGGPTRKGDGAGNGLGVGKAGDPMPTLTSADRHSVVYCLQGGGATSQNAQGMGYKNDTSYTLNTTDVHGVVYALDQQGGKGGANYAEDVAPTLCSDSHGTPHAVAFACNQRDEVRDIGHAAVALRAQPGMKQQTFLFQPPDYIVRRLTPTECARLQGFADGWGEVETKADLTDEEYKFWHDVRNTHAAINGKAVKDYTKPQILTWYNKLHTDSAEYKMWGNGIALPPALYCMQGIVDALDADDDLSWIF